MRRDNRTDATRPVATGYDTANATDETLILSVPDAAVLFGISAGAVRKRLERGQLHGRKVSGQWQVVLERDATETRSGTTDATNTTRRRLSNATTRHDRRAADETGHDTTTVSPSFQSQLAIVQEIIAPFVAELGEAKIELGRVQERLRATDRRAAAAEDQLAEALAEIELLREIQRWRE